jgi:energy-coupling factor transporter ATP-binding protein EcfA2
MKLGYNLTDWEKYGIKTPVNTDLIKNPHCLITGKSGSGKSQTFLWYMYEILKNRESLMYLADFKAGKEYAGLRTCFPYSYADNAIQMILNYYDLYCHMRKEDCMNTPHITLAIEEWFGLLSYIESFDKKLKTEIMNKVGEILALGRGIGNGIGIILLIQRADSSNFTSGSREQFQNICCLGRISKEQKTMLFSGEDIDLNKNYSAGQGLTLIDGQGTIQEIIIPWIPEQSKLLSEIHFYLDKQSTLQELIAQFPPTDCGA